MKDPAAIDAVFEEIAEQVAEIAMNFGAGALDDHLLRCTVDEMILGMPTPIAIADEILTRARAMIASRIEIRDAN